WISSMLYPNQIINRARLALISGVIVFGCWFTLSVTSVSNSQAASPKQTNERRALLMPDELADVLAQKEARPLSLASADFDEDGVPDLLTGYATTDGTGIINLQRGNIDALYPHSPEAQQRRAKGSFTPAPFLPATQVIASPDAPTFLAAGDFNADKHRDIVLTSVGSHRLYFLLGDGGGGFQQPQAVELPGAVTAFTTGECNSLAGLPDVVVGLTSAVGAQVFVLASPRGALHARPEIVSLPEAADALTLGQVDEPAHDSWNDLIVGARHKLIIIHGRDNRLDSDDNATNTPP